MLQKILLFILLNPVFVFAQTQKNVLSLKGEMGEKVRMIKLECPKDMNSFSMNGIDLSMKGTDENVTIHFQIPVEKGIYKIKVDKDGDLRENESFSIIFPGQNPPVDTRTFEVDDEADFATVTIIKAVKSTGYVKGSFSAKFKNVTTYIRELSATCDFETE